jgi:hypothetical protein
MANNTAEIFHSLEQAQAALTGYLGWGIYMNPTNGGHSAQGWGLSPGMDVEVEQGSPAMASADAVVLGRPFIPIGRPTIIPLSPGQNNIGLPLPYGAAINWDYGPDGGAATLSWSLDSGAWQMVDEILSPNRANVRIASRPGGGTWQIGFQITSVTDTSGVATLYADGVSQGPIANAQQVTVSGEIISIGIEVDFPTPSDNGFAVGYVIDPQ